MNVEDTVGMEELFSKGAEDEGTVFLTTPDGNKIPLSSDYSLPTDKISLSETYSLLLNQIPSSWTFLWTIIKKIELVVLSMQNGDVNTIVLFTCSIIAGIIISYYILGSLFGGTNSNNNIENEEKEEEEKIELRDFTIEQLRKFDGSDNLPIYISLKRVVFDVSSAQDFYGAGSGYNCFAGKYNILFICLVIYY
jgi:hypothetical protein